MRQHTILAFLLVAFAITACGKNERARCAQCGMYVDIAPRWRAGAATAAGREMAFDTPHCLLVWMHTPDAIAAAAPWVTEYYSQRKRPAPLLFYVKGSDVVGPMGRELVPIEGRDAAERFSREHHGDAVLAYNDIDDAVLATVRGAQ